MPRPARPRLTREGILRAALALADEAGVEALSMRALAKRLDVDPMSIYHHVENKAALLDGLAELLIAEVDLPSGRISWDEWIRVASRRFLEVAERHPKAFTVLSVRGVSGRDVVARFEAFAEALDDAGFDRSDTWAVIQSVGAVMQGFAMLVVSPALLPRAAKVEQTHADVDPEEFQVIGEVTSTQPQPEPAEVFRLAIDLFIDGLASRAPTKPGRRRRRNR